ncbi:uncharacterized protein LOC127907661 [Oncorhynchus keta]|uniref:uncharacterized protein LOC127907661 n=1 Tax=Oncorhynchus keta TaxID=8018 RepID=UPI00227A72A1|nr:uncharacterized protein LOC127907661 [Oncorhynchus keta]
MESLFSLGELIGLKYLFDQTGLVLQDHKAAIEELETGDPGVQGEDDEGFVELVEYQDLTVPGLETALPLVGTCRPTPTPPTSIQSTAASVSPLSSSPVRATPPPGPLSSTLGLVLPLSYVPVRATPPPGPLSSTLGLVLPLSYVPVRATPPPGPLSSTLGLVIPLSYVPVRANVTP